MHKAVQAPKNKIRRTGEDRAISVFIFVVMTFVFFVTAYPFWYSLVLSFSEGNDALRGGIYLWPRTFTLANYNAVFGISYIPTAFLVSWRAPCWARWWRCSLPACSPTRSRTAS